MKEQWHIPLNYNYPKTAPCCLLLEKVLGQNSELKPQPLDCSLFSYKNWHLREPYHSPIDVTKECMIQKRQYLC